MFDTQRLLLESAAHAELAKAYLDLALAGFIVWLAILLPIALYLFSKRCPRTTRIVTLDSGECGSKKDIHDTVSKFFENAERGFEKAMADHERYFDRVTECLDAGCRKAKGPTVPPTSKEGQ